MCDRMCFCGNLSLILFRSVFTRARVLFGPTEPIIITDTSTPIFPTRQIHCLCGFDIRAIPEPDSATPHKSIQECHPILLKRAQHAHTNTDSQTRARMRAAVSLAHPPLGSHISNIIKRVTVDESICNAPDG